ncbi:hypothetical protein H9L19_06220 [Weissella diestrammenae]|uniref:Uncharacterized protein n=1 Tax=Weissella diestrammenae TaxID=1162633 RepID=A0A7G9T4F6_9LACO|nr:hypothetical protein [Weissella diestrammenae]QNN74981.1 hypothetical protein H9L19_06220 [Weissella diestrammenae]
MGSIKNFKVIETINIPMIEPIKEQSQKIGLFKNILKRTAPTIAPTPPPKMLNQKRDRFSVVYCTFPANLSLENFELELISTYAKKFRTSIKRGIASGPECVPANNVIRPLVSIM